MITIPGLIDPHTHMREPGDVQKEDWTTGTAAALAGGYTCVLAMPNTKPPLVDAAGMEEAATLARQKALCDFGLYVGAGADNTESAAALAPRTAGLKMYLDQTYGPLRLDDLGTVSAHMARWPAEKPIVAHAEGRAIALAILLATLHGKKLHLAHVSRAEEIALVRLAKEKGLAVTCEVTPHHLFLTEEDLPRLGAGRGEVRPTLASKVDQQALWDNLAVIDCIATDHAPHTIAEKDGETPPPGFPGLETALALLLGAVRENRLTMEDVLNRMYNNPKRIFGIPDQPDTFVTLDPDAPWTVRGGYLQTRCAWSPFEGMQVRGRVMEVILRGEKVYAVPNVVAKPGTGRNIFSGI